MTDPDVSDISPRTLDDVDGVFREHHARGAAPSMVWATFTRAGLLRFGHAGEAADGTVPGPDTAYRIASCTKSFTAATVLALRDAGMLNLDDPVTRFVPEFSAVALPGSGAPVPTIRMLLTMSAGFPTDDPWADRQESLSRPDLNALLQRGLAFDSLPGTRFAYSNLGYALIGRVIEQASGRDYRDLVDELFLVPLGLTGTGFDSTVPASGGVAVGTRWLDTRWQVLPFSEPGTFSPIGGLFSTVTDLSRWAGWLADAFDHSTPERARSPLSRASRREMQQQHRFVPSLPAHPTGYGLGLFVEQYERGGPVVSHSGGYPGFSAHMRWSAAAGFGVVAFANATFSRAAVASVRAFDLLAESRTPPRAVLWSATRAAQLTVTALVRAWNDEIAQALFADNVALDESFEHRVAHIMRAVTAVGGLAPDLAPTTGRNGAPAAPYVGVDESSQGPAHLVWFLPGLAGRVRVEIRLTPELPPRVQTLTVSSDRVL
ncbi:MAG: serine hydrolase [Cryobacterium sp.]